MNRLTNDLLKSAHRACDAGDTDLARTILWVADDQMRKLPAGERRRIGVAIVAAWERLWGMRVA